MQITEEEDNKYKAVMLKYGYTGMRDRLHGIINYWRSSKIRIAVAGESGAGKSTFINSIRGLRKGDPEYATAGNKETTTTPTRYRLANRPNLEIWDLPGFGSRRFSDRKQYLHLVDFSRFDFILLLSSHRFTHNDAWFAKEIVLMHPAQRLYFVRTQVDLDIIRLKNELSRTPTDSEIGIHLNDIKEDCSLQLKETVINNHDIFLINSYNRDEFDFNALVCKLIDTVDSIKHDAIVLSLKGITKGALYHKLNTLKNRISDVSKVAGVAGAYTNRDGRPAPVEVDLMLKEANYYREELGLELEAIGVLANGLNVDTKRMLMELNMKTPCIVESQKSFADFYKEYDKFRPGVFHSIPLLGGWLKSRAFQVQCAITLKAFLDICALDVRYVHAYISNELRKGKEV